VIVFIRGHNSISVSVVIWGPVEVA
jgi:hypothetical protein